MGDIQKEVETQYEASIMSPYWMPPMSLLRMDELDGPTQHPFHKY